MSKVSLVLSSCFRRLYSFEKYDFITSQWVPEVSCADRKKRHCTKCFNLTYGDTLFDTYFDLTLLSTTVSSLSEKL